MLVGVFEGLKMVVVRGVESSRRWFEGWGYLMGEVFG